MLKEYILSIDAGTGSCRAVLFDLLGNQVEVSQEEWNHKSLDDYSGSQIFDTQNNWKSISYCIRNVVKKANIDPKAIKAVSSTSMREGMVLYNQQGNEIWACPNVDARADSESRELINKGFAEEIYFESGDWVSITSPSRLMWIRNHQPQIYNKISKINMLSDWILYRLSGEFVTDYSIASSSGLLNISDRIWSKRILEILELDESVLPNIYDSGSIIGSVHRKASEETGLVEGTPVVVGGADTQLALVGIGQIHSNQFTVIGGSFWQSTVVADKPIIDKEIRLRTLCHSIPDKWMVEGVGFYSGLTMRWFRDAFCDLEKKMADEQKVSSYMLMEQLARKVPPGSNGVTGIFTNVMNAKKWVHPSPSFLQFDINEPGKSGKKECIRAIQENAAYVVNGHKQIIEEITNNKFNDIVFTGGGAKGQLWAQIIADVLGTVVHVPQVKESSALGAAIYGGVGIGIYNDIYSSINTKFESEFHPNSENHERYLEFFDKWVKMNAAMYDLVEKDLTRPLWKAIGT
ncbi:autoinducer-2 kinase [Oceanobacillus profundus]|uniref:autoinducer-2 kinase n=1 Tax=Oceanobacillus profundus TaxID=372463 RepID=UPI003638DFAC